MLANLNCMIKTFTSLFVFSCICCFHTGIHAQTVITRWDFNSVLPDANTVTGSTTASTGSGIITAIGGTTSVFASGDASGGSSDPATGDDSGWGNTSHSAQGTNDKSSGINFSLSTAGYTDIIVTYDVRHSNTSSRYAQFQYTTDVTAAIPVWVDAGLVTATAGDTWFARSFNLSSVTALNNNPTAGFRVVAVFEPATSLYAATGASSTYAITGNWRFDMVTVNGTGAGGDVTAPLAQSLRATSATNSFIKFSEVITNSTAVNLANYLFSPALTISNATLSSSGDTIFITHQPFINGQPYVLGVSGVQDAALNIMTATNLNTVFNAALPNLVITEIIHSPNDIESIEIYNAGSASVNLGGLRWTDGTGGIFPEVSLAAGATTIFATAPSTATVSLNVSPVYTLTSGLSSSNDILVIRNSLNQVVDSVAYFIGINGWPSASTGVYGYSFELNAAINDNNLGSNWIAPLNPIVPQPVVGIIRATPGVYPTPVYTPANAIISFVGTKKSVSETTTTVDIVANLLGGGASPSSVDLELLPLSTATAPGDFTLPASLKFSWPANANNVNQTISFTINNDALPENAEYFIVRFANPVNIALPAAAANHFTVTIADNDKVAPVATQSISLNHIASFSNGAASTNSAEIVAHDPASQRLFIANSIAAKIDIVNFSNPSAATLISSIAVGSYGNINSIAVKNGIVAAAIENSVPELAGKVVFFDINGNFISQVNAGAMPDMITFNNAGTKVLTANEGQPKTDYTVDPEGTITVVDISGGVAAVTQANVSSIGFSAFNGSLLSLKTAGVRIFGANNPTVAQDMEPEYITISNDDQTAWVTCQENNAIAVIDLVTNTVTDILPLGTKNHALAGNALDISDQGGVVEIANWPVKGLYMPDAIASYSVAGKTYLITANEGDARDYSGYSEILRASSTAYILDPLVFPYSHALKANIGRLNVTTASGDIDNDGDFDEIHAYGSRSVSIWDATTGALVWDSGDQMEMITSKHPLYSGIFNASNANNTLKNRSDDKGPEPEGVTIATIAGQTYAFIALERIGGCMVYNVTDPTNPVYVDYKNTRNLVTFGGDNGAEGIIYISAANSPTGLPIVILANEVSSTLTFYSVNMIVLDITLADIKATNNGTRNHVSWNTLAENTGDVFEIERSKNGTLFEYLASEPVKGIATNYSYTDELPYEGVNFYRLKLKHGTGRVSYSPIVSANVKGAITKIQVYPNPVKDKLTLKTNGLQLISNRIDIINMEGLVVKKLLVTAPQTTVDVSALPAGVYTLRYFNSNGQQTIRINKQ